MRIFITRDDEGQVVGVFCGGFLWLGAFVVEGERKVTGGGC